VHETVTERMLIRTCVITKLSGRPKIYEVPFIFELYEYDVNICGQQNSRGDHFVQYIDTFLKLNLRIVDIQTGFEA